MVRGGDSFGLVYDFLGQLVGREVGSSFRVRSSASSITTDQSKPIRSDFSPPTQLQIRRSNRLHHHLLHSPLTLLSILIRSFRISAR